MPVIIFNGDATKEQAVGPVLDSGVMRMFAVRKDRPLDMISIGGHMVSDAPNYTLTDAKINPEYRHLNGRNVVIERTLTPEKVKSMSFDLMLPNKLVSVTDTIARNQEKFDYDVAFVPSTCGENCDEFFWIGEDLTLGARQITSAIIGFDDQENPIQSKRSVRIAGQLKNYYGMVITQLPTASENLYAQEIGDEGCTAGDCPFQTLYRAGDAGLVQKSVDGGNVWTTFTTTAITTDLAAAVITSLKEFNGYLIIGYSDVPDAAGTDGGIAYVAPSTTTAVLSTGYASAAQKIVSAFNKLWVVGGTAAAAVIAYSCDNGVTWTTVTNTIGKPVLDAAFDSETGLMYLVGGDHEAWAFDGTNFSEITTEVGAGGTVELLSVTASGGHVVIGAADGKSYQNFTAADLTSTYTVVPHGTDPVGAVAKDEFTYRTLLAHGADLYRRDFVTYQNYQLLGTLDGDITSLMAAPALKDEGVNTFFATTDAGGHYKIAYCFTCVGEAC